eukprot:4168064-Prorocentrum_lima.AAC.1
MQDPEDTWKYATGKFDRGTSFTTACWKPWVQSSTTTSTTRIWNSNTNAISNTRDLSAYLSTEG